MESDSSALVAILRREPEADGFIRIIADAGTACFRRFRYWQRAWPSPDGEATQRHAPSWTHLLVRADMQVMPQDAQQAQGARDVFLRYGKSRHAAARNLGDCATYALARARDVPFALAKARDVPLLFKGDDFTLTDVAGAA